MCLFNYGSQNNRSFRFILVVNDEFSKSDWIFPSKNKYAQTKGTI